MLRPHGRSSLSFQNISRVRLGRTRDSSTITLRRGSILLLGIYLLLAGIVARLFYWQVIQSTALQAAAENQYQRTLTQSGQRGSIFTSDGFTLVQNKKMYRLFAHPHLVAENPSAIATTLATLLAPDSSTYAVASSAADQKKTLDSLQSDLLAKLTKPNSKWISLQSGVSEETKERIEALRHSFIGFDPLYRREYPEASLAAHVVGFVGKDSGGSDIGYFGLEGALENELKARTTTSKIVTDALGVQLGGDASVAPNALNGRNVYTTIRRDIQHLVEEQLAQGIERYGAKSGEIIVMDPKTGKILGMAAFPKFEPAAFFSYDPATYRNPSLTALYEPGSTFKTLTVAAGVDAGVISASTECTKCATARQFGKYTIRTWNDSYTPNITMEMGLAKSDNTAMIFIAELLGKDRFSEYLRKFGVGEPLKIELQGDVATPFPNKMGPVELATTSFGQGVSMTSLQLMRAVSAIANGGEMMRPQIVERVQDPSTGEVIFNQPVLERRVVSNAAASEVTKMMVTAAAQGEAQWIASKTHTIAGKTGTSQVAVNGSYDPDKTIASFIGFAPPNNPKFIMLVKLNETTSSPWAAETAAPLWYKTAEKLYLLLNIPPDHQ
jgi:stage V sporulation protein D (sporulation-specific penicillin-binding protein)